MLEVRGSWWAGRGSLLFARLVLTQHPGVGVQSEEMGPNVQTGGCACPVCDSAFDAGQATSSKVLVCPSLHGGIDLNDAKGPSQGECLAQRLGRVGNRERAGYPLRSHCLKASSAHSPPPPLLRDQWLSQVTWLRKHRLTRHRSIPKSKSTAWPLPLLLNT